jgi:hypothetical protein
MSEDRLDEALHEMKQEDVDAETLESARARVWEKLANPGDATCAEFRPDLRTYLSGELAGSRRVLMEDHLSRCPACRARMTELRAEGRVVAMPQRSPSRWTRWATLAAAAALVFGVFYLGRGVIDRAMAPGGPRATVVSAEGSLYRLPEGVLKAGATVGEAEAIRTGPGSHAMLRLADGSMVDVNERTELSINAAWSGQTSHLQRGDIVVRAARQRRGHLRVLTHDSIASVKGTVFAVSAGMGGSVVSVVEGSVAVNQPGREVVLRPGEQAASNPALASSVQEAVSWSPEAQDYAALLGSFARIERQLAQSSPTELRTEPGLLRYLPAGAVIYGAVPNLGGTIDQALVLAEQQSSENAAFGTWWNSDAGRRLRQMLDRIQSVNPLLGDEVVFCAGFSEARQEVPMVIARVQPGKRAELTSALFALFAEAGSPSPPYSVSEDLMVVSDSPSHLQWALAHLGQGADSPFAAAIAARYERGAGWLVGMDATPVLANMSGEEAALTGARGMKYLFLEQRAAAGAAENEVTLVFQGARMGMASWLAGSGSGGAAEYLPADSLLAGYVSTREPWQLFQEITAQMTKLDRSFQGDLARADEKLGAGFFDSLTAAMGTEAAFALRGFSVNGPTWLVAALANDPQVIDHSVRMLVDVFNSELPLEAQDRRIVFEQEDAGGRVWNTLKPGRLPFGITWTYDSGYLVAASDRATAERAIATRNGGSPLVWSPEFLGQLPASAGMHPSAFAWLNTKGALAIVSALAPSPALKELLAEPDPVLVVFDGTAEQIHAASRTRISGLVMDAMLLGSLGRMQVGTVPQ